MIISDKHDNERNLFKEELKKRSGFFFKTYPNDFVRIGNSDKYLIEGKYKLLDTIDVKTILNNDKKIYLIDILPEYVEGTVNFNATVSHVDGKEEEICFFLPSSTQNPDKFRIIKEHEINHIRTSEILGNKTGEVDQFYSEILSDLLWISELESEELISIKLDDISELLRSKIPDYYYRYLKLIRQILTNVSYKELATRTIETAKNNGFDYNSIDEIQNEITKMIENYQ